MADETQNPLSVEEIASVDAQYVPFPAFRDWPKDPPRVELWERSREEFESVSATSSEEDLENAQKIAMRAAAFDTGAIEGLYSTDRGLTLTVATQAAAWEQEVDKRGADALALFEAQLAAFELVLDQVTNRFPKVTQAWIRRLHEEITGPQDTYVVQTPVGPQTQPVPKGQYKEHPNHVRTAQGRLHAYAPVDSTQEEMHRLTDELGTPEFRKAHPLVQAAYAHYALVAIHPFADGNGRVARAVASAYTYRDASVPLLVLAHHREQYFAALASADSGDPRPFVEFISRVARDALELVTETLKTVQAPQPEELLGELKDLFLAQGDLSHKQLDEIANGFTEIMVEAIQHQIDELAVPDGVSIRVAPGSGGRRSIPPRGFRAVVSPGPRYISIQYASSPPASAGFQQALDVFVSTSSDTAATVLVRPTGREHEQMVLGLADLQPETSSTARLRTENFSRRMLGVGLADLLGKARSELKQRGY